MVKKGKPLKKKLLKREPLKKDDEYAMMHYNKNLKMIEQNLKSNGTTYNTTLHTMGKELFGVRFKGVFASDMIPQLSDLAPYAILNLDKSYMRGSHWIAIAKVEDTNDIIVYDSFGRTHSKIIPSLLEQFNSTYRIIDTDLDAEQNIREENCGQRSLAFLKVLDEHGFDEARLI
jgi:hypothetical protein